jgi:hypothetical protein
MRKGHGLTTNHGKSAMATRAIPLGHWLAELLTDRRTRMATRQGISPDDLTGIPQHLRRAPGSRQHAP